MFPQVIAVKMYYILTRIPRDGGSVEERMTREQLLSQLEEMRQQLHLLDSCRQEMHSGQAKYERLLESAPDAMLFLNRNGRIVLSNAQLEELFGYAEGELIGMDVHTLIPERYHARHRKNVANYFSNPIPRLMGTNLEIYGLRKDKTEFPADISLSPLETDGEILVIASIRDITERKLAEQQIERNYRIQTVISSVLKVSLEPISLDEQINRVLDLILTTPGILPNAEGYIYSIGDDPEMLVLRAHRHSTGREPPFERIAADKCMCQGFRLTCTPDAAPSILDGHFCTPIVSSGQTLGLIMMDMKEGSTTTATPDAEMFLVAIANTLATVIMRHQAEAERNKLRDQSSESEKLAALGRIAANVADELRNPLTAVGGFARRLEKKCLNVSKEKEYVAFIVAEVTRMEGILRSVLSLSRGAARRMEQCDLSHIAEEAVRLSEKALRERSIAAEKVYHGGMITVKSSAGSGSTFSLHLSCSE